jgi:hypothetical protein
MLLFTADDYFKNPKLIGLYNDYVAAKASVKIVKTILTLGIERLIDHKTNN